MKVKVERVKDKIFGKPTTPARFIAEFEGTGWASDPRPTKEEAAADLHRKLMLQDQNAYRRKYVRKGSVTFCLYYSDGWHYDIVRDNGSYSSCGMGRDMTEAVALGKMLTHIEQHGGE